MSAPAGGSEDRVNSRCKDLGTVASIYLRSVHPQGLTLHPPARLQPQRGTTGPRCLPRVLEAPVLT